VESEESESESSEDESDLDSDLSDAASDDEEPTQGDVKAEEAEEEEEAASLSNLPSPSAQQDETADEEPRRTARRASGRTDADAMDTDQRPRHRRLVVRKPVSVPAPTKTSPSPSPRSSLLLVSSSSAQQQPASSSTPSPAPEEPVQQGPSALSLSLSLASASMPSAGTVTAGTAGAGVSSGIKVEITEPVSSSPSFYVLNNPAPAASSAGAQGSGSHSGVSALYSLYYGDSSSALTSSASALGLGLGGTSAGRMQGMGFSGAYATPGSSFHHAAHPQPVLGSSLGVHPFDDEDDLAPPPRVSSSFPPTFPPPVQLSGSFTVPTPLHASCLTPRLTGSGKGGFRNPYDDEEELEDVEEEDDPLHIYHADPRQEEEDVDVVGGGLGWTMELDMM
jgi:hypothetical protein